MNNPLNKTVKRAITTLQQTDILQTVEQGYQLINSLEALTGAVVKEIIVKFFDGNDSKGIKEIAKHTTRTEQALQKAITAYNKHIKIENELIHQANIAKQNEEIEKARIAKEKQEARDEATKAKLAKEEEEQALKAKLRKGKFSKTETKLNSLSEGATRELPSDPKEAITVLEALPADTKIPAKKIKETKNLLEKYPQLTKWDKLEDLTIALQGGVRQYVAKEVLALNNPTEEEVITAKTEHIAKEKDRMHQDGAKLPTTPYGSRLSREAVNEVTGVTAKAEAEAEEIKKQKEATQKVIEAKIVTTTKEPLKVDKTPKGELSAKGVNDIAKALLEQGLTPKEIVKFARAIAKRGKL